MISNDLIGELISSPTRKITAGASLYNATDGQYLASWTSDNAIKSIQIERIGDNSKFFGYGICQKANMKLVDNFATIAGDFSNTYYRINFRIAGDDNPFYLAPRFYVSEVHRDENTGELSITAYDLLYKANTLTVAAVAMPEAPYSINDVLQACANALGLPGYTSYTGMAETPFTEEYANGANLDGTETIRELLDDIAEATQTIYYLEPNSYLIFRKLNNGNSGRTITKEDYFTLKSGDNRRLSTIYRTTELGDDIYASTGQTGTTQYIRDNAFWDFHEDVPGALERALASVGGLTINQFECSWRGDFRLEIGDKLDFVTKNGSIATSFLLNDTIYYDGSFSQKTEWKYEDNDTETAENPSSLGEAIKQTFAKVDKVNKQIDLVVSETDANSSAISALQLNEENINASVEEHTKALDEINGNVSELTEKVSATMTAEDVKIEIEKSVSGVNEITTTTGFTFDETGLTVEKSGQPIKTTITEDGMTVSKDGEVVLTANNEGVTAHNLHSVTYLIVGANSRFEDFAGNRTGCFWIGQ